MRTKSYPKHSRADASKLSKYRWWMGIPLGDYVDRAADVFPGKEAVVDDRARLTYEQLREKTNKLAIGLIGLGIKKGRRYLPVT